ncbi:MAG: RNA-binding cell elongation regulator Jag/EloR [bacterium]
MKRITMKGKNVDEAVSSALEVLGGKKEDAVVKIITEGKGGMLGMIGGQDAEVEVILKGEPAEDAKEILQEILDKMEFMAMADGKMTDNGIELEIKGEDMGRIIGKEGATIAAFETVLRAILGKVNNERIRLSIDAGDYKKKRADALIRLAKDVADEVEKTGEEKPLPPMNAFDRRTIHMSLQENVAITTYSKGEGKERRLIIGPKQ